MHIHMYVSGDIQTQHAELWHGGSEDSCSFRMLVMCSRRGETYREGNTVKLKIWRVCWFGSFVSRRE